MVSSLVEPDTIIVQRNWDNSLQVKEFTVGKKSQKIEMSENGGTSCHDLTQKENENLSISNEVSLKLAEIGVQLEKIFGTPRDIEWAEIDDNIFLLQSRPITSYENFTEFELTHELGYGVPNDMDILSFANVGEVFPCAVSPLTLSTVIVALNASGEFHITGKFVVETFKTYFPVVYNRLAINYINVNICYLLIKYFF